MGNTEAKTVQNGIPQYVSFVYGKNRRDTAYNARCPSGSIVTGMSLDDDDNNIQLKNITCKPINKLNSSESTLINVRPNISGAKEFSCPIGSGVNFVDLRWNKDDNPGYLGIGCSSLSTADGGIRTYNSWGNDKTYNNKIGQDTDVNRYLSGVHGFIHGSDDIDSMGFHSYDLANARAVRTNDEAKLKVCSGTIPQAFNIYTPSECDNIVTKLCKLDKFKNAPECSCINSNVIKTIRQQLPDFPSGCAPAYDSTCNTSGYKPSSWSGIQECAYGKCDINVIKSMITSNGNLTTCKVSSPVPIVPAPDKPIPWTSTLPPATSQPTSPYVQSTPPTDTSSQQVYTPQADTTSVDTTSTPTDTSSQPADTSSQPTDTSSQPADTSSQSPNTNIITDTRTNTDTEIKPPISLTVVIIMAIILFLLGSGVFVYSIA